MTWERALVRDEKLHGYPVLTGLEELFDPAGGQRIYQTSHTEFVDSQGRRVGTVECEMVEVLANETFFRHGPLASTLPLPPPEQATPLREDELVPGVELPIRSWTLLRETLEHWAAALATLDKAWSSRAPFDNGFLRAGMLVPTLTSALPPEARLNELSLTIVEPLFLGESHIASARIVEVQENDNCERVLALEIRGRTSEGRLLTRGTAKLIMPGGRPQPHSGIVV